VRPVSGPASQGEVVALARRIAELGGSRRAGVYRMSWWSEHLLSWAMSDPRFKTQLFRLVDVLPATTDDDDLLAHVQEYLGDVAAPRLLGAGIGAAGRVPFGERVTAAVVRRNVARMARQFIIGTSPQEAVGRLHDLWKLGSAATVDLLGEHTFSEAEADRYAARLGTLVDVLVASSAAWAPDDHLERDDLGPLPRVSVSLKPTALASHFRPLTADDGIAEARRRLAPVLRRAVEGGVGVFFDMESYEVKGVTHRLVREVLEDPELDRLHAGVVVQAYLRDSRADLGDLVEWSHERVRRIGDPSAMLTVRLVKGAYWDTETVVARAAGWPVPVYEEKGQTDANYEACVGLLHDSHGKVRAAFGTHNLRSLAVAVVEARRRGIPDSGYELQLLYGMAEPVHAAVRRLGLRLRVYAPVGELVPGMAYLVRRLLENTSNESFVRHRFAEGRQLEELLAPPPDLADLPVDEDDSPAATAGPRPYRPEPHSEWRRAGVRLRFAHGLDNARGGGALDHLEVPVVIGTERIATRARIASVDPTHPDRVVTEASSAGPTELAAAVAGAVEAADRWRRVDPGERAAVLRRAAAWMRQHRHRLAALEIVEAGKPWAEADADVCEAVDFCEYYAGQMLRLAGGGAVQSPPGEANRLEYRARGVGAAITPWNFPLAIPTGMVVAALVAGNAVLFKPAEQTPAVAWQLVRALDHAGLPPGVLSFLPGYGEEVGAGIVANPDVSFIAFTGSRQVGLAINATAAATPAGARQVKRVVAEMGGKNAIVVDADADLDEVVPAVVQSAFGYAGQKCSAAARLVVVEPVGDSLVERVVEATRAIRVGDPWCMGTQMGPLIEASAQARVQRYVDEAPRWGEVRLAAAALPDTGFFAAPAVVDRVDPSSPLARDEIFGPVLAVFRAASFSDAIALANDTDYGLTAGVFSRTPSHIQRATAELRAGVVYVNRGITGAIVGRQPFGGIGLSGMGFKAGGPDYLVQFTDAVAVAENTLRQGFAPTEG